MPQAIWGQNVCLLKVGTQTIYSLRLKLSDKRKIPEFWNNNYLQNNSNHFLISVSGVRLGLQAQFNWVPLDQSWF